jgi:hypothetical protein
MHNLKHDLYQVFICLFSVFFDWRGDFIYHLKVKSRKILIITVVTAFLIFGPAAFFSFSQYKKIIQASQVYVINCAIFDSQMKPLKEVGGANCVYLKNGGVLVNQVDTDMKGRGSSSLFYMDVNGQVKWRVPMIVHHTMKASPDEKLLYLLTYEKRNYLDQYTKFDKVLAIEIESGVIRNSWGVYSIIDDLAKEYGRSLPIKPSPLYNKFDVNWGEVSHEVTHFNSINFIPPEFATKAQVIVNSGRGFVLFFTKDLKLSGRKWLDNELVANSHDIQITNEGDLLIYKNWDPDNYSYLEKRSFTDNKVIWKYDFNPEGKRFYAERFGSVQFFDDHSFLYSDMSKGGHFTTVSAEGKKINEFYYPEIDSETHLPRLFHTVRRLNFSELSNELQDLLERDLEKFFLYPLFKLLNKHSAS